MYQYRSISFHVPSLSTVLRVGSAWLTFVAVAAVASLRDATSAGDVVTRLALTAGASAVATVLFIISLDMGRVDEEMEARLREALQEPQPSTEAEIRSGRSRAA